MPPAPKGPPDPIMREARRENQTQSPMIKAKGIKFTKSWSAKGCSSLFTETSTLLPRSSGKRSRSSWLGTIDLKVSMGRPSMFSFCLSLPVTC